MAYHFRNLVFEGGGVKGIAYVGAMKILKTKGILPAIKRVGGTSAGAINATMFAIGMSPAEQMKELQKLKFDSFMDDDLGVLRDTHRLINEYGWHKGAAFHKWMSKLVNDNTGSPDTTFADLKKAGRPELYVYGTNLSTGFGEIFSPEHTPSARIADAVRISMSIPLFFAAVRNARSDVFVDGGLLNNFPIKIFDREKYLDKANVARLSREPAYYKSENSKFLRKRPGSSKYVYNCETLGLRLDSKQEIGVFRYGNEPAHNEIDSVLDYIKALVGALLESQGNMHLHEDDWHRTIYIDSLGVKTTDFKLTDAKKKALVESGEKWAKYYFDWYDNKNKWVKKDGTVVRPLNRPAEG